MYVLIVDDEPLARKRIRQLMDNIEGYNVVAEAENGEQALELFQSRQPSLVLMDLLASKGVAFDYHDPMIPKIPDLHGHEAIQGMESVALDAVMLAKYDCALIVTDHDSVDYQFVAKHANLIVDTRNVMRFAIQRDNIVMA